MSNFIPEMSGYFVFNTLDIEKIPQVMKTASDISQKSPNEIFEFLMILSALVYTYSHQIAQTRGGKKFNEDFTSSLSNMPISKIVKEAKS